VSTDLLARIRSGTWLDSQTFPPLSWAVPGIIPEGFGLFTGPPKAGKSWATLGLSLAVADGSDAFGKVPVGPGRPVLLLALEDGDRRLQDRCRRLLDGKPIPEPLQYVTRATPAEVLALIGAWLDANEGTRPLVVLDTLGKVSPPAMPGESAYARDYRIGGALKSLTDAHPGAALLVVHHVRKAVSDDWMDSTSGTNGLNGAADFTVSLSRSRNTDEASSE
jgi:RecA-family ATPase